MGQVRRWRWKKVDVRQLTPEQRRQRVADSLRRQQLTVEEIEEDYCRAIFVIEKELGHYIDDEYPVMKFLEEIHLLNWYKEQEKKQMDGIR